MTTNAEDLCVVADVKSYLPLSSGTDDTLLQRVITACSLYFGSLASRAWAQKPYTETRNGTGHFRMFTRGYPIVSVSGVTVDTTTYAARASVGSLGYVFDDTSIYLDGTAVFTRGVQNVVLSYTAGYLTAPGVGAPFDLQQAAIETVCFWYRRRPRLGETSKSLNQMNVAFSADDLTATAKSVIGLYSRPVSP